MGWEYFFASSSDVSLALISSYSAELVVLSFLISIGCSTVCFYIVEVAKKTIDPNAKKLAVLSGAFTLGCSVWSMHFIGMLALRICAPVSYNMAITLISIIPSMFASYLAINLFINKDVTPRRLVVSGVLVGAGIGAMHYLGMQAMIMAPHLRYQPIWFLLSVIVAIALSIVSLGLASSTFSKKFKPWQRISMCGTVLGCAVCFMHYLGMKAAMFIGAPITPVPVSPDGTGTMAVFITLGMLFISLNGIGLNLFKYREMAHVALKENEEQQALIKKLKEAQQELRAVQAELVTSARQAGMAEIATNVLHNVGNVLNSVNVSAGVVSNWVGKSKIIGLGKVVQMMNEHTEDLGDFLTKDEKGKMVPDYLNKLVETLNTEQQTIIRELTQLTKSIDHIKDIVATQQLYAGVSTVFEEFQIRDLIEDALRMHTNSFSRHRVSIIKEFEEMPAILIDKHRVLQILINLIGNAKNAMNDVSGREHQIILRCRKSQANTVQIQVEDNGEGISPENMSHLFEHGFTTRKNGHGFGLHSCVLATCEMQGSLVATSPGVGQGATFTLELPLIAAIAEKIEEETI